MNPQQVNLSLVMAIVFLKAESIIPILFAANINCFPNTTNLSGMGLNNF